MKRFVVVRTEGYMTSRPASSVFVYKKTIYEQTKYYAATRRNEISSEHSHR